MVGHIHAMSHRPDCDRRGGDDLGVLADRDRRRGGTAMEMLDDFDAIPQRMRAAIVKPMMWNFVVNHFASHHAV
jgi:hypothetical protein